ncbi:unnamed protein product, partial [Candidula unifasciata]
LRLTIHDRITSLYCNLLFHRGCLGVIQRRRQKPDSVKLDQTYEGQVEVSGEHFTVEDVDGAPGAFRAYLDVSLARTTTGARVFGALKGAADGAIDIPHSTRCFPGYDAERENYNAEVHRDHTLDKHVADYMTYLQDNDEGIYSSPIKEGVTPSKVEELYKKTHAAIRADPEAKVAAKKEVEKKRWNRVKLSNEQRKARIAQRKAAYLKTLETAAA